MFNSRDYLETKAKLVIAEVSFQKIGMGIELGWANMLKIPIICIYKKGFKPSSSLKAITDKIIEYENSEDLIDKLTNRLSSN